MERVMVYDALSSPALPIARSLGKRGVEVYLASKSRDVPAFRSKFCSKTFISKSFFEALEIAEKEGCKVFFPLVSESELLEVAKAKNKFNDSIKIACGDYEAVSRLANKREMVKAAKDCAIPVPKTVLPRDESDVAEFAKNGEFILKIKTGSSGRGTYVVKDFSQYSKLKKAVGFEEEEIVVQEFVSGKQLSVSAISNESFDFIASFVYERLRFYPHPFGPASYLKSCESEDSLRFSEKLVREVRYAGVVNFDYIVDERDEVPKLLDVNPRFWGSVNAAKLCGVDFPWILYLTLAKSEEIRSEYAKNVHLRSFFEDFKSVLSMTKSKMSVKEKALAVLDFLNFPKYREFEFDLSDVVPNLCEVFAAFKRFLR